MSSIREGDFRMLHMKDRGSRLYLLGLLALLAVSSTARAGVPSSPPAGWIYDGASLLKREELNALATLKEQLEQQTGTRLVVLTLASADGESSKTIAVNTLNTWNAGRKSALLLVLLSPRELYIQPGTELAPVLDSSTASSICSGVIAPKLRSGDRAGAIRAGLQAIAARLTSASEAPVASPPSTLTATTPTAEPSQPPPPRVIPNGGVSNAETRSEWVDYAEGAGGTLALGAGGWGLWLLTRRKCKECGKRMRKTSRVTQAPTYSSTGQGEHTFDCDSCGYTFSETYFIAQLVESTSSSSDSSWSSSSSDSSSSSSSSDGSGGGGSSW